ncbi:hypothetical protein C8A05DRAFT_33009 [Staphylotrichum tortipilum]|uniref:NADH:flavin oxidoreductase/NADH oxidase N-terminal domain-containing protein n=1 Tax=Staphylotrichum tortipilum TaxID=2831512 RepID=A0AAN6RU96_9PEZI|nr:hypothetical protein C8A05DRAFT_33009 [Staphylotrichum longicolle]
MTTPSAAAMATSRLFQPLPLTPTATLGHRIAMAPLTRFRASDAHVPIVPLVATYYSQRASSLPGTLLLTEATFISPSAGGYANAPGIYTPEQVAAWRRVTDAVHAKGGFIFNQLWSLGRVADPKVAEKEGFKVHGPSKIGLEGLAVPEEMSVEEIQVRVREYAAAAKNAIEAGFDGVEIHAANGYLIDQFLQDTANQRTDQYGGSVENRSRFAVEVVQAVVDAVGAERTGIRLSPWNDFQGMKMADPVPQFEDLIHKLKRFGLAYLHLVQSRVSGSADAAAGDKAHESLDFALNIWDRPVLIADGMKPKDAKYLVDEEYKDKDVVAVFGRYFIATPDLPFRIKNGLEVNQYNRDTFYLPKSPVGYIDQPFSKEYEAIYGPQALN